MKMEAAVIFRNKSKYLTITTTSYPRGLEFSRSHAVAVSCHGALCHLYSTKVLQSEIADLGCFCVDLRASLVSATQTRGIEIAFRPYELIVED
jgi:hypothetical protein